MRVCRERSYGIRQCGRRGRDHSYFVPDALFYKTIEETSGFAVKDRQSLILLLDELAKVKKEYDKIEGALQEVHQKGYGIVSPSIDELSLEEPEIVKQGSGSASA